MVTSRRRRALGQVGIRLECPLEQVHVQVDRPRNVGADLLEPWLERVFAVAGWHLEWFAIARGPVHHVE
jgi:hypothetical protein